VRSLVLAAEESKAWRPEQALALARQKDRLFLTSFVTPFLARIFVGFALL